MNCPLKLHVRPAITNMNDEQTLLLCLVKGGSFDNAFDIEILASRRISRPREADSGEVGEWGVPGRSRTICIHSALPNRKNEHVIVVVPGIYIVLFLLLSLPAYTGYAE